MTTIGTYDFTLAHHGSISLLQPTSDAGEQWVGEHIPANAPEWCGGIVIEHRFVDNILDGIAADGLTVEGV